MYCPSSFTEFPWMEYALQEYGVSQKKNPDRVAWYLQVVHVADPNLAWCSAFANYCLQQAGYPTTDSALARSWLLYRGANMTLAAPRWGCVTILWIGEGSSPNPSPKGPGHVGFYVGRGRDYITLLGGNQSGMVKLSNFPIIRVLGYVWPEKPAWLQALGQSA